MFRDVRDETAAKILRCEGCGASINAATLRCDYCGTQYHNPIKQIEIVAHRPGVRKIGCKVSIDLEMAEQAPEVARDMALSKMREQLADGLLAFMKLETMNDPRLRAQIIRGEVMVVEPDFYDDF